MRTFREIKYNSNKAKSKSAKPDPPSSREGAGKIQLREDGAGGIQLRERSAGKITMRYKEKPHGKGLVIDGKAQREAQSYDKQAPATLSGKAMAPALQSQMEQSFRTDFSNVRVHENSTNPEKLGAIAYTQGEDIHFAPGEYQPNSHQGRELLGHELTHVVQQRQGKVPATTAQGKQITVHNDDSLEQEADKNGAIAANGQSIGKIKAVPDNEDGVQLYPKTMEDIIARYGILHDKLENVDNDLSDYFSAWRLVMLDVSTGYTKAYNRHKEVIDAYGEFKKGMAQAASNILAVVSAGIFSWISSTGAISSMFQTRFKMSKDLADDVANTSEDIGQVATEKIVGYIKAGQTGSSAEAPLIYRNEFEKRIEGNSLDMKEAIHKMMKLGTARQEKLQHKKEKSGQQGYHEALAVYNNFQSSVLAMKDEAERYIAENPVPRVNIRSIKRECLLAMWKHWIPRHLRTWHKETPGLEQFDDPIPAHWSYDTWLGNTMRNHFTQIGIHDSGSWTNEHDVKAMIHWALNYEVKSVIPE
jgi:hypothetical protein